MDSLALFFSSHGSIARKPFALAVLLVYVLMVASQLLLTPAITLRVNVIPFVLVQGVLTFVWYALHAKRLRDTGRGTGAAVALAILYAMSLVLYLLLVELFIGITAFGLTRDKSGGELFALLFIILLVALFAGDAAAGLFFYVATAFLVIIMLPFVIAMIVSLWLATRPSAPASP